MEDKLDGLLQAYVRLLHAACQHREYLRTTDLGGVQRELAQLQKTLESDTGQGAGDQPQAHRDPPEAGREVRQDPGELRSDRCAVRRHRGCAGLIRDQSVTMRDPQQLSDHLDGLVHDVEQTEETVREVESIFENVPDFSGASASQMTPMPSDDGNSDRGTAPRNRVQN